jgi:hypothetical protein
MGNSQAVATFHQSLHPFENIQNNQSNQSALAEPLCPGLTVFCPNTTTDVHTVGLSRLIRVQAAAQPVFFPWLPLVAYVEAHISHSSRSVPMNLNPVSWDHIDFCGGCLLSQ